MLHIPVCLGYSLFYMMLLIMYWYNIYEHKYTDKCNHTSLGHSYLCGWLAQNWIAQIKLYKHPAGSVYKAERNTTYVHTHLTLLPILMVALKHNRMFIDHCYIK